MRFVPLLLIVLWPMLGAPAKAQNQITFGGGRHPTLSPDGSELLYENGGALWRTPSLGGSATPTGVDGDEPDWCPNSHQLVVYRNGQSELWTYDPETGNVQMLTAPIDDGPAWKPDDGSEIAVQNNTLWVGTYPGGVLTALACEGCAGETPAWSADGQWIYYAKSSVVHRVPATGGTPEEVTEGDFPAISRDGRWLAFVKGPGFPDESVHDWKLDLATPNADPVQMTSGSVVDRRPAWGLDSVEIWFQRRDLAGGQENIWKTVTSVLTAQTFWGALKANY